MREREASDLLVVGRVLAPWGVKGQVKVEVMTDSPQRLAPQNRVYLDGRPLVIEDTRRLKGYLVLKLDTIDTVEAAERLRGRYLEAPRPDTSALLPGEYYHFQLIGLEVWSLEGELLGRISDILATGANDVYVVQGERGEVLVPAVDEVVRSIDLEGGRMTVEVIAGLLD